MVREMVAVKSGQKKGFKTTEAFKRLSQGVPDEGNKFSLVSSALGGAVGKVQESAMAAQNMDPEALKSFQQMLQSGTNFGAYSVGANGPEGWEEVGNGGSQGAQMVILPAVAVVGALAAIAIPNFVKARTTSQQNACINNLRLFDAAKQQWALENRKQSTDTPTMKDLQIYIGQGQDSKLPVCPAGGEYTIGTVGEKPTCSIPGHVLP
jgi:competence protein ComGC